MPLHVLVFILSTTFAMFGWAQSAYAGGKTIFRCELDGVPTYSDRPCAAAAEPYALDENVSAREAAEPPASSNSVHPERRAGSGAIEGRAPSESKSAMAKRARTCARLAQALKDIRAKYRAGYTATQGERLKKRQEMLKSKLRNAQCS